ncbi:MAG: hypothetical protein N3A58_09025 [Spirochaetes bacterium]|nr:hypothetical protein [Spirochaetota bacterium]
MKRENEKDYRYIKPSEIAILVSSRKDAIKIQNYLYDKFGIDSTFYKKNLLYQSVESINIYFLIDYISEPDNIEKLKKIILSDLFFIDDVENINIEEIINENENLLKFIDEVKKLDKIFLQWNFLSRIFKLMDVEKNIVRKYGSKRAKNIIINYRHIIENIEKIAYSENLDIFSLKNKFLAMIFKSKESEIEEDLFRNYSEEDKINILTIHASKGLEFPIVFDFGAIKKINNKKNYPFYYKNGNVVIEYKILKENKEMYLNKLLYEEYRRLHYVAITRAIFLAYIPIFFDPLKNNKSIKDIEEKKAKMSFSEYLGTLDILFDKNLEGAFIPCRSENIENSLIFEDKSPYNKFDNKIQENYVSIDFSLENYRNYILELNRKSLRLTSFSSLHEKEKNKNIYNIDKILKELNDEIYIKDFNLEETNLLPKGEKTGSMFHELMEEIDYDVDYDDKINNKELENIISLKISKYFSDYKYEQQKIFQENTKSMIKSVLNLKILEPNFYIKNIKKMDRVNELEFYFKIKNGFISGFIDLIFRVNINGKLKYFIADWKTNIVEGIDINKHFEENYFLQAKIYEFSFFKYILSLNNIYIFSFQDLKLNREKFFEIYNNYFGGIFYIYTREVEKRRNGVVFLNPNFERLYNFVEDIENVFN